MRKSTQILENVISAIESTTGFDVSLMQKDYNGEPYPCDGQITFQKGKKIVSCIAEVKTIPRKYQFELFLDLNRQYRNFILLAETIGKPLRKELQQYRINYADAEGNIFLETKDLFVLTETGKSRTLPKTSAHKAFTKSGLKVVYALLVHPDWVNQPYRFLAEYSGAGLDTISKTMRALESGGYLTQAGRNKKKLSNTKRLLDRWSIAFSEKLKPALFMGRFRFLENQDWRTLDMSGSQSVWGGAPAGDMKLSNFRPSNLTLYTRQTKPFLMKTWRLFPDKDGELELYSTFWNWPEKEDNQATDEVLIYADLLSSGDPRERELATTIYERFIQSRY